MSKPEDIPQDVWDDADEWSGWPLWADLNNQDQVTIREGVARAIMAAKAEEREACAIIAENRDPHWPDDADHIAATIRKRGEA